MTSYRLDMAAVLWERHLVGCSGSKITTNRILRERKKHEPHFSVFRSNAFGRLFFFGEKKILIFFCFFQIFEISDLGKFWILRNLWFFLDFFFKWKCITWNSWVSVWFFSIVINDSGDVYGKMETLRPCGDELKIAKTKTWSQRQILRAKSKIQIIFIYKYI